jgi:hypothetical protein
MVLCVTSLQQKKEPHLQAMKRRDKINYSNKVKRQEEIEWSIVFRFRICIFQYKINVNKIQISEGFNTEPEIFCECVSDVFLKHGLEERIPLEEMESFQF